MKKSLQSFALMMALVVPLTTHAAYVQLDDGVYLDGSTLYISSSVTSLGTLQVNPTEIYCYATIPPSLFSNTFTSYDAALHVPASSMLSYFTTLYWYNFNNITGDAVEPQSVALSQSSVELEQGGSVSLTATLSPSNATPRTVNWSSTNTEVATVNNGKVTAIAPGECDIIATCVDKQAVCHVVVTPQRVTVTLNQHEALLLPNHTMTLTATCTPPVANLVVTTSDPAVAIPRYVNGTIMVIGVGEGTATITVSTDDGWCTPDTCEVTVYTLLGDVNADGFVDVSDVTALISRVLGNDVPGFNEPKADVNHDGAFDVSDVTMLIAYILGNIDLNPPPGIEIYTVNGVTFKMVSIEGGTFMMGASDEDPEAYDWEKPAHQVTLSSYSIGQTEVTQELWIAVMSSNPSYFKCDLKRPVERVSWDDCQTFIAKLNELTGKTFRLPTEAQWEYAARGGNKSQGYKYSGSNDIDEVAWYYDNSGHQTHLVATKKPNELGLYDMSGNVWEWVQDWCDVYKSGAQTNPIGPSTGSSRVLRGGGWAYYAADCNMSNRGGYSSDMRNYHLGLRLALDDEKTQKFRLSETVVEVKLDKSKEVNIINGNGDYTIEGGEDYVSSVVNGNLLTITGETIGVTTVFLTDNVTGAKTQLNVIVIDNKEVFFANGVSFTMVPIKGGSFTMGATAEQGSDAEGDESPTHRVTLSSYCIGQTEVTQALWQAVMGSNPSLCLGDQNRPVEQVTWEDCQTFISKLNELTGKQFRLPTEAEWEFAARGGNKSQGCKYAGSNTIDDVAWYIDNCYALGNSSPDYGTHAVATKAPNELGLYDMSGNVWEWCQDWYGSYSSNVQTDPTGSVSGSDRVRRGGSWVCITRYCRVSRRQHNAPSYSSYNLGLRLALDVDNIPTPDEHEWVDLGLPSGTLWATCNVGASSPEEYGDYFAWGETEPKDVYVWSTYKWCNGTYNTLTKYCTDSYYGTIDGKVELDPEDDAAYVNWGQLWRMPNYDQLNELKMQCTWSWTTQNGVEGCLVTGPNGNTLFLPAAGFRTGESHISFLGDYWSNSLFDSDGSSGIPFLRFNSGGLYWIHNYRSDGRTVRAVRASQN